MSTNCLRTVDNFCLVIVYFQVSNIFSTKLPILSYLERWFELLQWNYLQTFLFCQGWRDAKWHFLFWYSPVEMSTRYRLIQWKWREVGPNLAGVSTVLIDVHADAGGSDCQTSCDNENQLLLSWFLWFACRVTAITICYLHLSALKIKWMISLLKYCTTGYQAVANSLINKNKT